MPSAETSWSWGESRAWVDSHSSLILKQRRKYPGIVKSTLPCHGPSLAHTLDFLRGALPLLRIGHLVDILAGVRYGGIIGSVHVAGAEIRSGSNVNRVLTMLVLLGILVRKGAEVLGWLPSGTKGRRWDVINGCRERARSTH